MALRYKVVELSNVDEGALEHAINEWVRQGWTFDGVQFAMRESSKRPSMGFVFFTREVLATEDEQPYRSKAEADTHLQRLVVGQPASDAWARLAQLAGEDAP